jgi:anaerobic ribonucleoside-triphosphate reductase activating protein
MSQAPDLLNIHAIMEGSRANGPGRRIVVWFQGCNLGCKGCFNPRTHSSASRELMSVRQLAGVIGELRAEVEGITITGGEPLQQGPALLQVLRLVRTSTDLSVVLFSGHSLEEIQATPEGPEILGLVDVLIAGPYVERLQTQDGILGSTNQTIHLLTSRYSLKDLELTPAAEMSIDRSGQVVVSGVHPPSMDNGKKRRNREVPGG